MTKKRAFLRMEADFKNDFFETQIVASNNPSAGKGRWIFPETETVLIIKIGEQERISLSVLRL